MPPIQLKTFTQYSDRRLADLAWTQSALIRVQRGCKRVYQSEQTWEIPTNSWLWLPAGARVDVQNQGLEGLYQAQAVLFESDFLHRFLPTQEPQSDSPSLLTQNHLELAEAWNRLWDTPPQHLELIQARGLEVLAWLGTLGIRRAPRPHKLRTQLAQLFHSDPARAWQISEMASSLSISVDTLQRQLRREKDSFDRLIRSLRMEYALELLQTTHTTMDWIASQVGYQSRSKFAARFKERFGLLPSEIRKDP